MRAIGMDLSKYLRLRALAAPVTAEEATPIERVALRPDKLQDEAVTSLPDDKPTTDQEVEDLTKRLRNRGMTTPAARREARKRLGL